MSSAKVQKVLRLNRIEWCPYYASEDCTNQGCEHKLYQGEFHCPKGLKLIQENREEESMKKDYNGVPSIEEDYYDEDFNLNKGENESFTLGSEFKEVSEEEENSNMKTEAHHTGPGVNMERGMGGPAMMGYRPGMEEAPHHNIGENPNNIHTELADDDDSHSAEEYIIGGMVLGVVLCTLMMFVARKLFKK